MKTPKLAIAMGYIDDKLVSGSIDYQPQKKAKPKAVGWLAAAACFVFICLTAFQIAIDFTGTHALDPYCSGACIRFTDMEFLSRHYSGDLLIERLSFDGVVNKSIDLYYDEEGNAELPEDWHSVIIGAEYTDHNMTIFALFHQQGKLEEWKVPSVFTADATQIVTIAETAVHIAPNSHGNLLPDGYYAIFEYENVIYEVRVTSNDIHDTYSVLNALLTEDTHLPRGSCV